MLPLKFLDALPVSPIPIPMMSTENQCVEMAFNSTDIPYRTMNSPSFGGSLGHVSMHVQLNLEVLHFQKITV